ncbi:MAG: serine hydrolase [Acidobacteriota bacterium]|nr:serine hydrolase [Acidobacteriota bacterium]
MSAQSAPAAASLPKDTEQHVHKIESCLSDPVVVKDDPDTCRTLAQRLAELHVPGVSIAVVHNGAIEWAQGFGVEQLGGKPVNPGTLFQAGSISKPVAAMAALHLVQQGKLTLDSDVNTVLVTWKIPPNPIAPNAQVTLRELLTHTAGFTVHGFPGYAANAPVPSLVQVLNGEKPANTAPIRLESIPGSKWNYSGGGYTVMQQVLLDVAKEPFPKLLNETVLAPMGMTHSTYDQPLPSRLQPNAATPYAAEGAAIPGGAHTYPEMAAAGLWTTPSDLARYIIENQQSLVGKANHVLSQQLTQQMLTPGKGNWGLGVEIGGSASNPYFSHGGVNEGFESLFVGYERTGEGAVVMTNAQGGSRLASEIMGSIAVEYNWPDFRPVVRTTANVSRDVLARYVGTYQLTPAFSVAFTLDGDQLMTQATGQEKIPVFPESDTKFFLKVVDAEVEFFSDDKGEVSYLILHQGGHDTKAIRKH